METIIGKDGHILIDSKPGIGLILTDRSFFGRCDDPIIHFPRALVDKYWRPSVRYWYEKESTYADLDSYPYPEVIGKSTNAVNFDFCVPSGATCLFEQVESGEINIRIFAVEMPGTPVMDLMFPNPENEAVPTIYRDVFRTVLTS